MAIEFLQGNHSLVTPLNEARGTCLVCKCKFYKLQLPHSILIILHKTLCGTYHGGHVSHRSIYQNSTILNLSLMPSLTSVLFIPTLALFISWLRSFHGGVHVSPTYVAYIVDLFEKLVHFLNFCSIVVDFKFLLIL